MCGNFETSKRGFKARVLLPIHILLYTRRSEAYRCRFLYTLDGDTMTDKCPNIVDTIPEYNINELESS